MIVRFLAIAALVAAPAMAQDKGKTGTPAAASSDGQTDSPPKRVRSVLLYGDEACPKPATPDEVVVCAKEGESPYRIPKQFRKAPEEGPAGQAWATRVEGVMDANRAGLPNSCSPIGSGGQTGCTQQMLQQWARAQRDKKAKEAQVP